MRDMCDKGWTKVRSEHGMLTFRIYCVPRVTAKAPAEGKLNARLSNIMQHFKSQRLGSNAGNTWQLGEMYCIYKTVWVVLK